MSLKPVRLIELLMLVSQLEPRLRHTNREVQGESLERKALWSNFDLPEMSGLNRKPISWAATYRLVGLYSLQAAHVKVIFRQPLQAELLAKVLAGQMAEIVAHELISFGLQPDGHRLSVLSINARESLVVDF